MGDFKTLELFVQTHIIVNTFHGFSSIFRITVSIFSARHIIELIPTLLIPFLSTSFVYSFHKTPSQC